MNHPNENTLLLLAYGELSVGQAAELESHVAGCEPCGVVFARLERARVALDDAMPRITRRRLDWTAIALAAAAVAAVVFMMGPRPTSDRTSHWAPTTTWSPTAGYMTGGRAMIDIDAQLTQLERGFAYGRP
jgi:anti-sigma factor RsiW